MMMIFGTWPMCSRRPAALMTSAGWMWLGVFAMCGFAMCGCAGSPPPQDEPAHHDAAHHDASTREETPRPGNSENTDHSTKPNQETPYNKGNIDQIEAENIEKNKTLAPGEHPAPQAPGLGADGQPSPVTLALAQVIERQRERIAACHQAHDPASAAWGDCLCQAMCQVRLAVQPPLSGPTTLRWPMISAAMGAFSISYDASGQAQQCGRQTRLVSEVFFCQAQVPEDASP